MYTNIASCVCVQCVILKFLSLVCLCACMRCSSVRVYAVQQCVVITKFKTTKNKFRTFLCTSLFSSKILWTSLLIFIFEFRGLLFLQNFCELIFFIKFVDF